MTQSRRAVVVRAYNCTTASPQPSDTWTTVAACTNFRWEVCCLSFDSLLPRTHSLYLTSFPEEFCFVERANDHDKLDECLSQCYPSPSRTCSWACSRRSPVQLAAAQRVPLPTALTQQLYGSVTFSLAISRISSRCESCCSSAADKGNCFRMVPGHRLRQPTDRRRAEAA